MIGACNSTIFWARFPGEGLTGQISLNFNDKIDFKEFYTKLCVFSQIKAINISNRIFVLSPGPEGWGAGCPKGQKKFEHGLVAY